MCNKLLTTYLVFIIYSMTLANSVTINMFMTLYIPVQKTNTNE